MILKSESLFSTKHCYYNYNSTKNHRFLWRNIENWKDGSFHSRFCFRCPITRKDRRYDTCLYYICGGVRLANSLAGKKITYWVCLDSHTPLVPLRDQCTIQVVSTLFNKSSKSSALYSHHMIFHLRVCVGAQRHQTTFLSTEKNAANSNSKKNRLDVFPDETTTKVAKSIRWYFDIYIYSQ